MKELKIFGFRSTVVWSVFIVLIITIFAFMLASLGVDDWVKLRPEDADVYDFKGNLLKVLDGLTKIPNPAKYKNPLAEPVDISDNVYGKLACSADFLIATNPRGGLYPTDKLYLSWGDMFDNLWIGGGLYLAFEIVALVCCVVIVVTLVLFYYDVYYFNLNFFSSVCMWVSHVIAILGWIGIVGPSFKGDCDELTNGSGAPTVCALQGPKLGVFILIYASFVMVIYYLCFCVFVHNFDKGIQVVSVNEMTTKRETEAQELKNENLE